MALVVVKKKYVKYLSLILVNLIYACTTIFTKLASEQMAMSLPYLLYVAGAVGVMGIYALLWQQIIARIPLSTAYMFKGTSLIFILVFSFLLFGESITLNNVIGSLVIITGIFVYSLS